MARVYTYVDRAVLGKKSYTFKLPRKIRTALHIISPQDLLGFFEDGTDISISLRGNKMLATSEFTMSYGVTLKEPVRKKLGLSYGDPIYFYSYEDKIILKAKGP